MCYPVRLIFNRNQQHVLHMCLLAKAWMCLDLGCCFPSLLRRQKSYNMTSEDCECEQGLALHMALTLQQTYYKNQRELYIILCYRQNGSCPSLQLSQIGSCSLNSESKTVVLGCAEIQLQAWVFLLMEDLLLLASWKQSSNKCGPIYHLQHITGQLGVIIHAGRGMNRPFRGSWAQTLKRASPLSFSTGQVDSPSVSDVVSSTYLIMNVEKSTRPEFDNGKCAVLLCSVLFCFFS